MKTDHPLVPVTCLSEGHKNRAFETALAAWTQYVDCVYVIQQTRRKTQKYW